MSKKKLGVIFGGMSTENEVSIVSANSVLNHLEEDTYQIYPIYIDKEGKWWEYEKPEKTIQFGTQIQAKQAITNIVEYLKQLDVIFPVLHGLYGEDGTIQGLFELLKIPYVGCHVLASSVGMDKVYTKVVFEKAGLKQANYEYVRKDKEQYLYIDKNFNERYMSLEEVARKVSENLNFPMFIKPSNSGSSVGINKAKNIK